MCRAGLWAGLWLVMVVACDADEAAEQDAPAPKPATPVKAKEVAAEPPVAADPNVPADPDEACARILVVAWQGAAHAGDHIERSQADAKARAAQLLAEAKDAPAAFGRLAAQHSDAPSSAARQGLMGTFTREDWPPIHAAIRDGVFALPVHAFSAVMEAPYGYVIAQRCPVEKAHARHILIRYRGAERADASITRSKAAAKKLANELRGQLSQPNADFAALARKHSEDGSAERGGDLGNRGRGVFVPAFESALYALKPGEISDVVETELGFHVIQRVPD